MQTNILRAIALTAVGNAALSGRDVSGFWPTAAIFRYSREVEFVIPHGDHAHRVAADPNAWFAWLSATGCRGLRLHMAAGRQSEKLGHIEERMMVGMVGGGPRWLIEAVGPDWSTFWEGFDRVGDRSDPRQQIWLNAYVALDGAPPATSAVAGVSGVSTELREALTAIEAVARADPWKEAFAGDFVHGREILDGATPREMGLDFVAYTDLDPSARRLLAAASAAWVFGGMGSWNDGVPDPPLAERYEQTSAALFAALKRAVVAVANATLP